MILESREYSLGLFGVGFGICASGACGHYSERRDGMPYEAKMWPYDDNESGPQLDGGNCLYLVDLSSEQRPAICVHDLMSECFNCPVMHVFARSLELTRWS